VWTPHEYQFGVQRPCLENEQTHLVCQQQPHSVCKHSHLVCELAHSEFYRPSVLVQRPNLDVHRLNVNVHRQKHKYHILYCRDIPYNMYNKTRWSPRVTSSALILLHNTPILENKGYQVLQTRYCIKYAHLPHSILEQFAQW